MLSRAWGPALRLTCAHPSHPQSPSLFPCKSKGRCLSQRARICFSHVPYMPDGPTRAQSRNLEHPRFKCGSDEGLAGAAWCNYGQCARGSGQSLLTLAAPTLLPISLDVLDISRPHSYTRCGLSSLASVMSCVFGVHLAHCMPQEEHTASLFIYFSDD